MRFWKPKNGAFEDLMLDWGNEVQIGVFLKSKLDQRLYKTGDIRSLITLVNKLKMQVFYHLTFRLRMSTYTLFLFSNVIADRMKFCQARTSVQIWRLASSISDFAIKHSWKHSPSFKCQESFWFLQVAKNWKVQQTNIQHDQPIIC